VVVIRKEILKCKTKRPIEDGEKVVAVTTRINDFPTWYGVNPNATIFGYPVPNNIRAVDHSFDVAADSVTISWATDFDSNQATGWHRMEIDVPVTEEKITALLVAMKLSC
jgi:hypothetical protein